MMKKGCAIVVAELFLSIPMILMGGQESTVQVAGLRVVGSGYGLNGTELRAFNQQSGTTLALVVQASENKKIIEVDDSKCSLVEFTDDRDHNLLDGVDWGGFPKITEDGRLAMVEVTSKNRPSQDATRIFAKGAISLRVAATDITEKIENLKPEVGTKVSIGQEAAEVMKAEVENDRFTFVLQVSRKFMKNMKDIRFYSKGSPIEIWSQGSFTFGNASQLEYYLDINSIPEALKIEIDIWQELETLEHSFEVETGLGF